jgi:hypothetical protein
VTTNSDSALPPPFLPNRPERDELEESELDSLAFVAWRSCISGALC